MKIILPLGAQYACDFAYILISKEKYRIEYCHFTSEKQLSESTFLSNLYQLTDAQLQKIGQSKSITHCATSAQPQQITITTQFGYEQQPGSEAILWRWQDTCTTSEVNGYVAQFKRLLGLQ